MKKYADHECPGLDGTPTRCYDCGLPYGGPAWVEAVVANDVWEVINPTHNRGCGLLCIGCIAARCVAAGLDNVPVKLTGGVLVVE